jgi:amino-acid N-acetyltransferase
VSPAIADQLPEISRLLEESGLPTSDLAAAQPHFWTARNASDDAAQVAGVVGLEVFGRAGLVRSLVVRPELRGDGLGHQLIEHLEHHARNRGLEELVLLTNTAEAFFAASGYVKTPREELPDAVHGSSEFRSVCPASATAMRKRIAY